MKTALKQVYFKGMTIQVPEIWNVDTEELTESDGQKAGSISINGTGTDRRSIDLSYGPMPEGSDAYAEACGTYEEVMGEEDLDVDDEPIICFQFQESKAYGFNVYAEDGFPCFFFCLEVVKNDKKNLLTVLACAPDNEELQNLIDFTEEYLTYE